MSKVDGLGYWKSRGHKSCGTVPLNCGISFVKEKLEGKADSDKWMYGEDNTSPLFFGPEVEPKTSRKIWNKSGPPGSEYMYFARSGYITLETFHSRVEC